MANEMPQVLDCQALQCIYNKNGKCHTLAITVGDEEPCCDTFKRSQEKGGFANTIGGVGACKVADCQYNNSFECTAKGIHVIMNIDHPDCGTFKQRKP